MYVSIKAGLLIKRKRMRDHWRYQQYNRFFYMEELNEYSDMF